MQSLHPERFDMRNGAKEWPLWIDHFERFRIASGLDKKGEKVQVNTLLFHLGRKAEEIFKSFNLTAANADKYDTVKQKFQNHFVRQRNVIYERAVFNQRVQREGEKAESFITALFTLAEHCAYDDLREDLIRDRIVVGIRDHELSRKLQLQADLTLERVITQVRQNEDIHGHQPVVRAQASIPPAAAALDAVATSRATPSSRVGTSRPRQSKPPKTTPVASSDKSKSSRAASTKSCGWCGANATHPRANCPAANAECGICRKHGHYARVCRSAPVRRDDPKSRALNEVAESDDAAVFLGALHLDVTENSPDRPWLVPLRVGVVPVVFKIDSGADATAIPESLYRMAFRTPLTQPTTKLRTASGANLSIIGMFRSSLSRIEGRPSLPEENIYVIKDLHTPLLSRNASTSLQLIQRIDTLDSTQQVRLAFPKLFTGLGKFPGQYTIQLKDNARPFSIAAPRRVAVPRLPAVKEELERMERLGVVSKVDQPTEWCAGMVVVPKSRSKVRICADFVQLNASVKRERHMLPAVDHILAQIAENAAVFSKLDANSGFWQIILAAESSLLTTFMTPFGRYRYHRLPFGISSAPEYFQKKMSECLAGLAGTLCLMDDILIYGSTQEEHDTRLRAVLTRLQDIGITLNYDKCVFSVSSLKYLGQIIDRSGVRPDPDKVKAVTEMAPPRNLPELRSFLGMVNQFGKFIPHLSNTTEPLRSLLSKGTPWKWDKRQADAFKKLKSDLTSTDLLAHYSPHRQTVVTADASSFGLGAVLLQKQDDDSFRPVSYVSKSLTPTQQRYAQIEKEEYALCWACDRFSDYLLGMDFHAVTDHKPLVSLLSPVKRLEDLPPRVQRFRLRLRRFSFTISHCPGAEMFTPDTLSRAPLPESSAEADDSLASLEIEADLYQVDVLASLPISDVRLKELRDAQAADEECQAIMTFCSKGWPAPRTLKGDQKICHSVAAELTVSDGLLLRGQRLYIPRALRQDTLARLHAGHQGIVKCRARAATSVWWPGLSTQLASLVNECSVCRPLRPVAPKPLLPSDAPNLPWEVLGSDLFEWNGAHYLLVVDYLSRFPEIAQLPETSSSTVISRLKSIFARHGIPKILRSDNGPQYSSTQFAAFAKEYGFAHITSSPNHPQSYGEAERMVKTVKSLLFKSSDPNLALMVYRSSSLANGLSPAEILMGRRIRTTIPLSASSLVPATPPIDQIRQFDQQARARSKEIHDDRHRAKELPSLREGDTVWIKDREEYGRIIKLHDAPRSYVVASRSGEFRRNRRYLVTMNAAPDDVFDEEDEPPSSPEATPNPPAATTSRSGRRIVLPARFQ